MGWMGKVVGGTIGFALGGPLGAILGATFGHAFDSESEIDAADGRQTVVIGRTGAAHFFCRCFFYAGQAGPGRWPCDQRRT